MRVRTILGAAAGAAVAYIGLVAWRGTGITRLTPGSPRPALTPDEAQARIQELRGKETSACGDACRTLLLEPDGNALGTILYFHGFTNSPAQFRPVGEVLCRQGYRVIAPRQPRHGLSDRMNRSLRELQAHELIDHIDSSIDIAAGYSEPLHVVGFSGGGNQAAWAAATRREVRSVLVVSPATSPSWARMPLVRLFVRFRRLLPGVYIWWDPILKADRPQNPYEYPGFPLPGIIPILYLGAQLGDRRVRADHRLTQAVLLSNRNDHAVSRAAAEWMMQRTFADVADDLHEVVLADDLGWAHDFIDPEAPRSGGPEQVAEVILAALGLLEDPTAGGMLEPAGPL